jgi:hypothetical protein
VSPTNGLLNRPTIEKYQAAWEALQRSEGSLCIVSTSGQWSTFRSCDEKDLYQHCTVTRATLVKCAITGVNERHLCEPGTL